MLVLGLMTMILRHPLVVISNVCPLRWMEILQIDREMLVHSIERIMSLWIIVMARFTLMSLEIMIMPLVVPHLLSLDLSGSLVLKNLLFVALIILLLILAGKFTIGVLFIMSPYFLLPIINVVLFVIHSTVPRGSGHWLSFVFLFTMKTILTSEVFWILLILVLSVRSLH